MEDLKLLAPNFPPGFRFYPSDEELIIHYLKNKVLCIKSPNVSIMADINLYKFNPWELPTKALFGESEWYFFSPRDRLYPNGSRANRTAASGYWKATGTDKPIISCEGAKCIGVKKVLVFYTGRPPKGKKTDWMMYEYRLLDKDNCPSKIVGLMRLDDWVLCRIRQITNKSIPRGVPSECNKITDQINENFKDTKQNMDFSLKYSESVPKKSDVVDEEIESLFLQGASKGDFTLDTNLSPTTNEGEFSYFFRVSNDS